MLLLCLALTACGFHPMYAQTGAQSSGQIPPDILIETLPGREGQVLHNALEDLVNPSGQSYADPRYRLSLTLSKVELPVIVDRDGTIRRYNIQFTSTFRLNETASGKELLKGNLKRMSSYDVLDAAHFATYASQQDQTERALKELAESLRMRLGGYFAGKP